MWVIVMVSRLKIGAIVTIAFVAGIVGTLSFTSLDSNSNSAYSQSVGLGANVFVDIIRDDGSKVSWEGHNDLTPSAQNFLVACITGLDETPYPVSDCVFSADDITLEIDEGEGSFLTAPAIGEVTLSPEGCDTDVGNDLCSGWTITAVFDFDTLNCDEGVDCPILTGVSSIDGATFSTFNYFAVDGTPEILPLDRILVQMDFDVTT